jgi:ABC-type lipoprotein release transport system permease subunit
MKIPLKYTLRNFWTRRLTTGITIFGIALVVFVFSAVLMMAYGVQKTLVSTGSDENAIVVRKSSQGEISSIIMNETMNIILALPYVAKGPDGAPIASGEPVVVINLDKKDGGISNVTVRGVSQHAFALRPLVKLKEGRTFNTGARELIVGASIRKRFKGAEVGDIVKFKGDDWTIVGAYDSDGSGFDSELWGDALQLEDAFNRTGSVSTLTFRMARREDLEKMRQEFEHDNRLNQFEPKSEQQYFEEQSEFMALFIRILGIFITVIFSAGAMIGAMITMYAAVANRTVEIGTLRALGFQRRSVMAAFMMESLTLSLIGGVAGLLLASVLQFVRISTLNFNSFAELEFAFALSPTIVISSLLFALLMGFIGGFLPALRASRLNIVNALRSA